MATSKTLTPTNVTIQIPEFTDQPDQRVNSNCIDKLADAINALNTHIPYILNVGNIMNVTAETKTTVTKSLPDNRTPIAAFVSDYDTYSNTGLLIMRRFSVSNGEITLQFIASAATSYVDVKVCLIY